MMLQREVRVQTMQKRTQVETENPENPVGVNHLGISVFDSFLLCSRYTSKISNAVVSVGFPCLSSDMHNPRDM